MSLAVAMNPVDLSSSTARPLPRAQRVVVTDYGETPDDALERHLVIQSQPAPDPAELQAGEVLVGIRSAAVTLTCPR